MLTFALLAANLAALLTAIPAQATAPAVALQPVEPGKPAVIITTDAPPTSLTLSTIPASTNKLPFATTRLTFTVTATPAEPALHWLIARPGTLTWKLAPELPSEPALSSNPAPSPVVAVSILSLAGPTAITPPAITLPANLQVTLSPGITSQTRTLRLIAATDAPAGRAILADAAQAIRQELARAQLAADAGPLPPTLARALLVAAELPTERWRAEAWLAAGGPELTPIARDAPPQVTAALSAWAQSTSTGVAVALGRLAAADQPVAAQVARRLLLVGTLPTSEDQRVLVPLWADPQSDLTAAQRGTDTNLPQGLLDQLMSPDLTAAQRRDAAQAWLAAQPTLLAWTLDDAGLIDGTTATPRTLVAAITLSARGTLQLRPQDASNQLAPTAINTDPTPLLPLRAATIPLSLRRPLRPGTSPIVTLSALFPGSAPGALPITTSAVLAPAPLAPPGLPVGPPAHDWTLETLRALTPLPRDDCAALLLWDPVARRPVLIFERSAPISTAASTTPDTLTVYLGPSTAPTLIVQLTSNGQVQTRTGTLPAPPTFALAAPGSTQPRWSVAIPLAPLATLAPPASVTADQQQPAAPTLIQLGYTFTPADGRRAAWPRPMLPWQTLPARLAIDPAAWDQGLTPDPSTPRP